MFILNQEAERLLQLQFPINNMKLPFILIDDSELDCYIARKLIYHTGKSSDIKTFTEAGTAFEYIKDQAETPAKDLTIILLDILMPLMSGFEFTEAFEGLPPELQKKYIIVAITSSLNKNDIERVSSYASVKGVIDKPINTSSLSALIKSYGVNWNKD